MRSQTPMRRMYPSSSCDCPPEARCSVMPFAWSVRIAGAASSYAQSTRAITYPSLAFTVPSTSTGTGTPTCAHMPPSHRGICDGHHSGPTSSPRACSRSQSCQIPSKTTRFASPQASAVPPRSGAKNSPSSRRHSGARRSLSFSTPPSSRKTTRVPLAGALALSDNAREPGPAPPDGRGDAVGIQPEVRAPELLRAVIHPLVGHAEHLELDLRAALGEELAHGGPEAAGDDVLLDVEDPAHTGGEREVPRIVERLGEARVHDGGLDAVGRQQVGRRQGGLDDGAVTQDGDVRPVAERLGDADRQLAQRRFQRDTAP